MMRTDFLPDETSQKANQLVGRIEVAPDFNPQVSPIPNWN